MDEETRFKLAASQRALVMLAKCLMGNGALLAGQWTGAIRAALKQSKPGLPQAEYAYLLELANLLDEADGWTPACRIVKQPDKPG